MFGVKSSLRAAFFWQNTTSNINQNCVIINYLNKGSTMSTTQEQQELVDILKFIPRDVTINLYGYGGEVVIGTIDPAVYEYWSKRDDLEDLVHDWDREIDCPNEMRFIEDGAYYDIDNIAHETGVEMSSSCGISVYDELEKRDIFALDLDPANLEEHGVEVECTDETYINHQPAGTCVFYGQSFEKGTFFSATLHLTKPFDPTKLSIQYYDIEGWCICAAVYYDGEELEGVDGYSTTGKGSTYYVERVPGNSVNLDWADSVESLVNQAQPDNDRTPWFPVTESPVRNGSYEIEFTAASTAPVIEMGVWNGRYWDVPNDYKHLIIKQWRGLAAPAQY
jgi:hypothetical protein